MKIIFKVLIGFLNLIYCLFKMLPVKDKVTFISRQADRPTEDIQLLGKALVQDHKIRDRPCAGLLFSHPEADVPYSYFKSGHT